MWERSAVSQSVQPHDICRGKSDLLFVAILEAALQIHFVNWGNMIYGEINSSSVVLANVFQSFGASGGFKTEFTKTTVAAFRHVIFLESAIEITFHLVDLLAFLKVF